MRNFVLLVLALCSTSLSKSTIDNIDKLFHNTIKRWGVQIGDRRDYLERFHRLVEAKKSVDLTSSDVLLDSLNRFSVNNDAEQAALVERTQLQSNRTIILMREEDDRVKEDRVAFNGNQQEALHTGKLGSVGSNSALPESYDYWEKDLGLSKVENQASCGACWAFPPVVAMEALYKELTGEDVRFSYQYFVDCSFGFTGCAGGTPNDAYKITKKRQYLMSEKDWPYTADYEPCKFTDQIAKGKNNALKKAWLQDWYPMGRSEESFLKGLISTSPVAFGSYISSNYFSYSGGTFTDIMCAIDAYGHAQLLVGYTKKTLRIRGSYGDNFGENGYINYKRDNGINNACIMFKHGYTIAMTLSRDIQYEFCNGAKVATRAKCRASCKKMNQPGETGWDLAIIPTEKHNDEVMNMANAKWPGIKKDDKFNYLWTGLANPDKNLHLRWVQDNSPYTINYAKWDNRKSGNGKYGLVDKNSGIWILKNSETFQARGLCSRIRTCIDFTTQLGSHGSVTYSEQDTTELVEGTTADITCGAGFRVEGASQVICKAGQWDGDDSKLPVCVEKTS